MKNVRKELRGKWRIIESGTWDKDYLDLVEPAFIAFDEPGLGSAFRFGGVVASLDCADSRTDVGFTFHGGDETRFKARRWSDPAR